MSTYIKVHNANQIGGCITEIVHGDTRILIDYGANLPGHEQGGNISWEWKAKPVDAVFFTHYHGDHVGRLQEIDCAVPLYMGATANKILCTIHKAIRDESTVTLLQDRERVRLFYEDMRISIGNITVTPYSVDHSAYDAYMFLVETPDKTILHMGDFRGHGYRGRVLPMLLKKYVLRGGTRKVDILLTEGTMMSRQNDPVYTERDMLADAKRLFAQHKYVFLLCSSTNLDSLATFHQAARHFNRAMYGNWYVVEQLRNFSQSAGKKSALYNFDNTYVLRPDTIIASEKLPKNTTQTDLMRKNGFVAIVKWTKRDKELIERFADLRPVIVFSMWKGYVNPCHKACIRELHDFLQAFGDRVVHMHTSGHATPELVASVIRQVNPREAIIPMHTENAAGFFDLNLPHALKKKIHMEVDMPECNFFSQDALDALKNDPLFRDKLLTDITGGSSGDVNQGDADIEENGAEVEEKKKNVRNSFVFPAVRDDRIDFYWKGGKLFSYYPNAKEFETHVKYASVIADFDSDYIKQSALGQNARLIANFVEGYDRIKENCALYSGLEAQGVSRLYEKFSCTIQGNDQRFVVLDIELAIRDAKAGIKRLDVVVYDRETGKLHFLEAKHYTNSETRSQNMPPVVAQVQCYEDLLKRNEEALLARYKKHVHVINALFDVALPEPKLLDTQPVLLLFGFDGVQKSMLDDKIVNKIREEGVKVYAIGNIGNASLQTIIASSK